MSYRTIIRPVATAAALLAGLLVMMGFSARAHSETLAYQEDFASTTYRDPALTTAVWDTVAAQVNLPSRGLAAQGSVNTAGNAFAAATLGTYLLVADGTDGLVSLDISDPSAPAQVFAFSTLDQARDVVLQGNLAVLAIGTLGLQIIDAGNPELMFARGHVDVPGYTTSIALAGNLAYLAQSNLGVAVVDISDPDNPVFLRDVATGDWARGVALAGSALAVADGDSGLTMLDLSIPEDPSFLANVNTAGTVLDITVDGNRAYLAAGTAGMIIVDIANPAAPVELGSLATFGTCRHVAARGDSLYVASGSGGLYLVDASNPAAPKVLERADTLGESYHTTLDQNVAWLCDGGLGVQAFMADPQGLDGTRNLARSRNVNPTTDNISRASLTSDHTDSVKFELSVNGGTTWTEALPGGPEVDFPTPGHDLRWRATLVQTGPYPGPILSNLSLSFTRILEAAQITSVRDIPGDTGGRVRVAWAASLHDTLGDPNEVFQYSLYRRYAPDKAYPPGSWDYLLTLPADAEQEYSVVTSTLADSSSAGPAWTAFFVRARTMTEGVFYDSPVDSGYSVNNLQPPPPTGFQAILNPGTGYQLSWDSSPLTDFSHFAIYRSQWPGTPVQPGTLLTVRQNTSYFDATSSAWYYQLSVVNLQGQESDPVVPLQPSGVPGAFAVGLENHPNPFNPTTDITFALPPGGRDTSLQIFDTRGRLVRTLAQGFLAPGDHRFSWDGRDDQGRSVPSGVYAARFRIDNQQQLLKMTLVR